MNVRLYASIQRRILDQMDKKYVAGIYRALKAQTSSFLNDLKTSGLSYARSRLQVNIINQHVAPVILKIYREAGLFSAKRVRQELKMRGRKGFKPDIETKAGFGFNERILAEIREYFRLFLLEKAVLPISRTTIERIETILNEAQEKGWGVDEIVNKIEADEFIQMTRRRAQTIVRTETVRASNFGSMAAAYENEYETVKRWISVRDARTRRTHNHFTGVANERRDLLLPFSNGLQFPGDPEGPAKETVNCRCVMAYEPKLDENGDFIWKPETMITLTSALKIAV